MLTFVNTSCPNKISTQLSRSGTVRPDRLSMYVLLLRDINADHIIIVPEILFSCAVFGENGLVGPPDGLALEQAVHALKGNTLGLRYEEEDEDDGEDHHGSEEEVDTAAGGAHVVEHLRGETGDDEVLDKVVSF